MLHWSNIKKLHVLLAVLLVGCIAGITLYYLEDHNSDLLIYSKDVLQNRYPGPQHEFREFSFESDFHGKKLISIHADKLLIQKKKVGFFRFGLMKEAIIHNAYINIYGIHQWIGNQTADSSEKGKDVKSPLNRPKKFSEKKKISAPIKDGQNKLTFENVFKKSILPSPILKRVSSIVIKPVIMVFYDDQEIISRVSAESAVIRYKNRDILFSGNVIVTSGPRVLNTEQLRMIPEKATVKTDHPFIMETPEKQTKGNYLTTDICLGGFNL